MLRGVGATLALPLLDAMIPAAGLARSAMGAAARSSAAPIPLRMAAIFLPNGVHYSDWEPKVTGRDYTLSRSLEPLKGVKDDLLVLSNLCLENAKAKGDGPGDHARSAAAFLTGAHPFKTGGSNIKLGVSMDQIAAQAIGHMTRLPSLELGLDRGRGDCDSGYACAYVSNVSWSSDTTPMPKEVDPAAVFDRMFGTTGDRGADEASRQRRLQRRKSILDFVAEDTRAISRKLGAGDRHKIDEFTTSVREIEKRIESVRKLNSADAPKPGDFARPADGVPADVREHISLMWDLLALAFQTDVTRVSTFMMAGDGSDRHYTHLGLSEGHHTLSHHQNEQDKVDAIKKIDRFHMEQFARFVEKLKSTKEGDGTLLDHSMILCGAGIGDGNFHNHDRLPILLAGRGGGTITPGRHVKYDANTPLCNLYVSMLQRMTAANGGADLGSTTGGTARFGDSTGPLAQLTA
jgi:hypothetical protein